MRTSFSPPQEQTENKRDVRAQAEGKSEDEKFFTKEEKQEQKRQFR